METTNKKWVKMSEGRYVGLAHRDLGTEIEKIIISHDKWKKAALRAYKLAVGNSWDPEVFATIEEALDAYEEAKND